MLTRHKRKASIKCKSIIEISDTEEESKPAKCARLNPRSYKSVDEAATCSAITAKLKRTSHKKPTRRKQQEEIASPKQEIDNVRTNASTVPIEVPSASVEVKPSNWSSSTSGRSSFWERRKVWTIPELLAETEKIENCAAKNIVQLFENENTIPFICRYRRDLINHLTPDRLRDIKNSYTEIVDLRKKAETVVTQLEKEQLVNEDLRTEILCAKTREELEFLYAPYKPAHKGSLADRAKALGLEVFAERILNGVTPLVHIQSIVNPTNNDLDSKDKVINGICHIISHNISKQTIVLEELRRLQTVHRILLKTSKTNIGSKASTNNQNKNIVSHRHHKNNQSKYELYFDFEINVRYLKPHQILAINRGEKSKFLTIKIIIAENLKYEIKHFIRERLLNDGLSYPLRQEIFEKAFEECYAKKLYPLLSRQIRADLNEIARKAAIDVFAKNLKQLLLMSPLKGERILGIDPGFKNGCKLALISETAEVLETDIIYPHEHKRSLDMDAYKLQKLLTRHNCKIIALGNGTACRETEFWLSKLFESGILNAETIRYSIVSEQGASIYSCSEVARKEFPKMDTNEISAVSIARRLNDPLSEYVKIEPRHIGVGMYQHDINEKLLTESLNEVVSECVSYVGVDLNTASLSVLKHVAGLTDKKAEKIIEHRLEHGLFHTRKDLLHVKSVGKKTFEQCAGFVRIDPRSLCGKVENPLDCTWVHPESYAVAEKIIAKCQLNLKDIGSFKFIDTIKSFAQNLDMANMATQLKIPKERLEIVIIALQRELFQDYRTDMDIKPLFKQGITRMTDLSEGQVVTGAVTNVTHFGAFVDIGVEQDGLIHISKMKNTQLNIGDRVTASIDQVEVKRRRIALKLEDILPA